MADVENTQETVEEPKPNPYNAKKSWHTEDVMPKEGLTAKVYLLHLDLKRTKATSKLKNNQ